MERSPRKAGSTVRSGDAFTRSGLRMGILALAALKIVVLMLLMDPRGLQVYDLPKGLVSHALSWPLAALIIVSIYRYGTGIVPRTYVHLFVIALLAVNVAAAITAVDKYVAVFGEWERHLGLTYLADMALIYLGVAIACRTGRDIALLAGVVALSTLASATYGIMQFLGLDPLRFRSDVRARPFSTMGNPDMFALFMTTAVSMAAAVVLLASAPEQRRLRWSAAVVGAVAVAAAVLTATRAIFVGAGAGLVAIGLIYMWLHGMRVLFRRGTIAVLALALAAAVGVTLFSPLGGRVRATFTGAASTDRLLIYDSAMHAIAMRPVLGFGPDNFGIAYHQTRQPGSAEVFGLGVGQNSAHDWVLQAGATTGFVGLYALLALILGAVWKLARDGLGRAPLVAGPLIAGLATFYAEGLLTPNSMITDWFPWVAFGVAATFGTAPKTARVPRPSSGRWVAALMGASLGLAAMGAFAFKANEDAVISRNLVGTRSDSVLESYIAVTKAQSATSLDPGRGVYWLWLGLARSARDDWSGAAEAHSQAAMRQPSESTHWSNLAAARVNALAAGERTDAAVQAAVSAARRGIDADPNDPLPHLKYAEITYKLGLYDLSLPEIVRAMELYRLDSNYEGLIAETALKAVNRGAARALLERAIRTKDVIVLHLAAGDLALRDGDKQTAALHAARALELDPSNADAQRIRLAAGR